MTTYIREKLEHEDREIDILIEVDEEAEILEYASYGTTRGGETKGVSRVFKEGMALIRSCAEQVASTVRQVSEAARPEEVEIKFGVKLTGQVGAMIAKTGTEGNMEVTLKWKHTP